ncbi:hypothetical protein QUB74_29325, partial [Microcoleus sp. A2-C2]|uniref:hypothetical protein n=1 Tax=Microcoleus sp. A2-C2 TaxID=2818530 RepID=UPI002FCF1BC4
MKYHRISTQYQLQFTTCIGINNHKLTCQIKDVQKPHFNAGIALLKWLPQMPANTLSRTLEREGGGIKSPNQRSGPTQRIAS